MEDGLGMMVTRLCGMALCASSRARITHAAQDRTHAEGCGGGSRTHEGRVGGYKGTDYRVLECGGHHSTHLWIPAPRLLLRGTTRNHGVHPSHPILLLLLSCISSGISISLYRHLAYQYYILQSALHVSTSSRNCLACTV